MTIEVWSTVVGQVGDDILYRYIHSITTEHFYQQIDVAIITFANYNVAV